LLGPKHRQVSQALDAESVRKATLHCGFRQDVGDEREGQRHPDRALALALADGEQLGGLGGVVEEFVEPAMSVPQCFDETVSRAVIDGWASPVRRSVPDPTQSLAGHCKDLWFNLAAAPPLRSYARPQPPSASKLPRSRVPSIAGRPGRPIVPQWGRLKAH
jgi:hypothetical protein